MGPIMLASLITFVFGGITLVVYHIRRLSLYRTAATFPGDKTLPLIGNAHYFFGNTEEHMVKITKLVNKYSTPLRVWLGKDLFVAISDPEQIKTVLFSRKAIGKATIYSFLDPWLGNGLFSGPVAIWRPHRKLIAPIFHSSILEPFIDIFVQHSNIMINAMEAELQENEFNVYPYVSRYTLDIIFETFLGVPGNSQTERKSDYIDAVDDLCEILFRRSVNLWLYPDIIFNRTALATKQKECLKYLNGFTNNIIREKRAKLSDSSNPQNNGSTSNSKQSKKMLDLLMELSNEGTKFTNEEIRDEINTIIFGGYDTSGITLTFAIFMLANFPEVQQKCYDELCTIYGDKINDDTPIRRDDMRQMEYLERVIKETMRLFPSGPLLMRNVTDDLDIGKYTLPAGSTVILLVMDLHRRSDIWIDPLEFNPDRFLSHEVAERHPYSYIPFSGGPRNCLGSQFAMISMKILLATVLRKYIILKDLKVKIKDIECKTQIVIKPIKPITVKIAKR